MEKIKLSINLKDGNFPGALSLYWLNNTYLVDSEIFMVEKDDLLYMYFRNLIRSIMDL